MKMTTEESRSYVEMSNLVTEMCDVQGRRVALYLLLTCERMVNPQELCEIFGNLYYNYNAYPEIISLIEIFCEFNDDEFISIMTIIKNNKHAAESFVHSFVRYFDDEVTDWVEDVLSFDDV